MPIYHHIQGPYLKVHSFNATAPAQRPAASPPALILVCHGIYQTGTGEVRLPAQPQIRFAVEHGRPNDNIDAKWFQDIITMGLNSALEYDFKHPSQGTATNYFLGKGEPDKQKGATPADWLGFDKDDRLGHPNAYSARNVGKVGVLSTSYAENLMRFAESKQKTDTFDFATVTSSCRSFAHVLESMATDPPPKYDYLLCAFCRELAD